jgi:hypothetical protein
MCSRTNRQAHVCSHQFTCSRVFAHASVRYITARLTICALSLLVVHYKTSLAQAANSDGISFAIPIDVVKEVLRQLMLSGRVVRPYLGVRMVTVDRCEVDLEYALQQVSNGLSVTVSFSTVFVTVLDMLTNAIIRTAGSKTMCLIIAPLATRSILIVNESTVLLLC